MKKIELFNRELNQSLSSDEKQMNAFKQQVDLIMKSVCERLDYCDKAIIIGTGKMNDFSLTFFVKNFKKVILTDIDLNTVNEAVKEFRFTN